ncbi:MAG: putative HTH-type transcriptional regulator [Aeromicrobium sp.]|nr:putative HTH-type transcriptional regulator [Aeromicrobium sp.]
MPMLCGSLHICAAARYGEEMTSDLISESDLTAKARIRNAAFALVVEKGVANASLRGIAQRSGCSPSLVEHHFGSRQGELDAVSARVVALLRASAHDGDVELPPVEAHRRRLSGFERMVDTSPNLGGYVRRMMLDGTPEGLAWFKQAVDRSAADLERREGLGLAQRSGDVRAKAAMLLILGFAPTLLKPLLEHALDADFDDPASRSRWQDSETELLTSPLYLAAPPE